MPVASVESLKRIIFIQLLFLAFQQTGCTCGSRNTLRVSSQASDTATVSALPSDLRGVVKDSQGEPLPDIMILSWPSGHRGESVVQARTDPDGRFLLNQLKPGRWTLLLEAPGLGTTEVEHEVPDESMIELTVEGMTRVLSGIVVDQSSRPRPGALVSLGGIGLRWNRETRSDQSGIFYFRGLGFGRFTLRATLDNLASGTESILFEERSLRERNARLVLSEGAFIEGTVADHQGSALANARIEVSRVPSDELGIISNTGAGGHFKLGPLAPGRYQLFARQEDFVLMEAPEVTLRGGVTVTHRIKMARSAHVHGRLLDEAGKPLPNLAVTILSLIGGKDELTVIPGPLPLAAEAAAVPLNRLLRPGGVRSAESDDNGEFLVTGIPPGKARLQITPRDRLPHRREPLLLIPGDVRELGDITLVQGALISGKVEDINAVGVEGVTVDARLLSRARREDFHMSSDSAGRFTLRLPAGRYSIFAKKKMFRSSAIEVTLVEGQHLDSLSIRFDASIEDLR